jgi:DHA3 family macrolide efflux protein-like MFS transporter
MSMGYFGGTTTHASIAEIAFGAGMMGGGMIVGIWGGFKNRGIGMAVAVALMGAAISVSGLLPPSGFVVFAVMSGLMGLSAPLYSAPHMALMQEKIPPEFLGRIFGLYGSLMSFTMLIGLALSGLLADMVGINIWFLLGGIVIIILAIVTFSLPSIRAIDRTRE